MKAVPTSSFAGTRTPLRQMADIGLLYRGPKLKCSHTYETVVRSPASFVLVEPPFIFDPSSVHLTPSSPSGSLTQNALKRYLRHFEILLYRSLSVAGNKNARQEAARVQDSKDSKDSQDSLKGSPRFGSVRFG